MSEIKVIQDAIERDRRSFDEARIDLDAQGGKSKEGGRMEETKRDPQSRHYDHGGIETLDIIKAKLTPEQYRGFLLGNVIKYSCRANFKGNFERDMEKAGFYNRFLSEVKDPVGCANIPPTGREESEYV